MPDTIIVNVPPYDGEYEFDLAQGFSYVEWRWVKQISGYMPLTWEEGFKGGDPDLFLAFAVIALRRAGKITKTEVLLAAEVIEDATADGASISYQPEPVEEAEADPTQTEPDDSKPDSGESTTASSEPSPESESPPPTGTQDSDTGSDSLRLTSVS